MNTAQRNKKRRMKQTEDKIVESERKLEIIVWAVDERLQDGQLFSEIKGGRLQKQTAGDKK